MELSQSPNMGMQLPNQQIQNLPSTGLLQQQSQTLSSDAQIRLEQQSSTKFVFNVETDKTSPSLQLLFQLPSVQQVQQHQQHQQQSTNTVNATQQQHQKQMQMQQPCSNQGIRSVEMTQVNWLQLVG